MSELDSRLFVMFKRLVPELGAESKSYGPFGRDTIKVETKNRRVYIFTYRDESDWGIQTYKAYRSHSKQTSL